MAKSRSWRTGLIGVLFCAACGVVIAAVPAPLGFGSPAHAQTPKQAAADQAAKKKRDKRNKDRIDKLKKENEKLSKEITELKQDQLQADAPTAAEIERQAGEKEQEHTRNEDEIRLRTLNKKRYAAYVEELEEVVAAARAARNLSREHIEELYCKKDGSVAWKAMLKEAKKTHIEVNKVYYEARRRLRFVEDLSTERFGPGEIKKFRAAEAKRFQKALEGWKLTPYLKRRILIPGRDEDPEAGPDDTTSFEFNPDNCPPDSAIHASGIPVKPQTINVAVQLPEVCVGTTYILTEEVVFEEDVPVVTEDEEDPRDAQPPQETPGDGEDPRDVPVADIPITLTPEDEDDPRDTPQEDVPVVSIPDDEDEPRDVPREGTPTSVVSTPEDEPRDVPQEDVPDLGLVKAVSTVVALAVTDAVTGIPLNNVAVKLLPEEPPLPDSEVAEAPNEDEAFDEASFFEDDAEGGFTGEDGAFELTVPVSDPLPGRPGDTYPIRPSDEVDKDLSAWRKKYIDASKTREEIIGDMYQSNPDFKAAIDKINADHDKALKASKAEAAKQHEAIDKRKDLSPDAKKRLHRQTDERLALQEGRLAETRERERDGAAKEFSYQEPPDVQEMLEASIDTVKEAKSKIADLERELIDSKTREAELKEKKKAEQKTTGPVGSGGPLTKGLVNPSAVDARRLALTVDTEPHEQHVAGLAKPAPEGDAFKLAMSDAVLAPYVVSAFSIGTLPVAVLSVPKSEVDYLKQQVKIANTVSWFEPDPCWSKQDIDDPYFSSKGLWGQDYDDQWAIKRAGFSEEIIENARDNAEAKPITVAVIDTGIDWVHPDLDRESLWRNDGEIPDNGIDDDGNGYVDDVIGWNFINQNNKPWDYDGHGTFIAGVIGAASGNGTGIAGVNPHARLMPLKALDPFGQGYASMVAEAILYAADNGAKIINISLGGKGISRVVDLAIAHAVSKGALVVVAAGNEATDVSGFGPAGSEGVITVSATDQRDQRAGFSNWGEEVDIAAPGVDVMSLRARGTDLLAVIRGVDYNKGEGIIGEPRAYYRASGTSFAAPIVSGAASLIMSLNPDLDADAVRRMLLNTARDIEVPGIDNYAGYGLIDVEAALQADPAYNVESRITGAAPARVDGKSVLRLVGTANADDFAEATLSLGKGKEPSKWLTIKKRITEPVEEGVLMDIPAAALKGTKEWTIRLITKHKDGTEREARFAVTLG